LDPLKCTFWGYYISALRGCCALKFLHALEVDQGYLAHTPSGTGVPPPEFQSWKLKIGLQIQRISHYNLGASGSILTKHFPYDVPLGRGHNICITFGRPAPENLGGRKNRPKFSTIFDNFRFWSRISPERLQISKLWKKCDRQRFLPRSIQKVRWILVHKQKSFIG